MVANAARHDTGAMLEHRVDVKGDAVETDPVADADADRGDLVLGALAAVGARYPNADAVGSALPPDVERCEGPDHPFLQRPDIEAKVRGAAAEVEHQIGHALAGTVIGVLAAAA